MLPSPTASFKIPSLHDDLELDCRLYFPRLTSDKSYAAGCAIFAHPYAPLGGCYDDPVVQSVGSVLLKQAYVVFTFNFRGADKSPGKTSWSGKAELADYVSLYALALSFVNTSGVSRYMSTGPSEAVEPSPLLVLGGYSYGSMIASHVTGVEVVLDLIQRAQEGSTEYEIVHRGEELGQSFLGYCEAQQHRGRKSLTSADALTTGVVTVGGYESPAAARRISKEGSRRSIDVDKIRQSVDRVRRKLGNRVSSAKFDCQPEAGDDEEVQPLPVVPRLAHIVISPLLGPVASFATVFSRLKFESKGAGQRTGLVSLAQSPDDTFASNPSLVVFGSDDHFTSSRKTRQWCETVMAKPGSRLHFREVKGAGHFWHDPKFEVQLADAVGSWLTSLL